MYVLTMCSYWIILIACLLWQYLLWVYWFWYYCLSARLSSSCQYYALDWIHCCITGIYKHELDTWLTVIVSGMHVNRMARNIIYVLPVWGFKHIELKCLFNQFSMSYSFFIFFDEISQFLNWTKKLYWIAKKIIQQIAVLASASEKK